MKKRVIIVHGWDGYPEEGWFPWLKQQLESHGFDVIVPQLPNADEPRIERWVSELARATGAPDEQTYFVGHSMGCQAIVRYLSALPAEARIGSAVFVAGFFKRLTNLEDDPDVHAIAREWLETPVDLRAARSHMLHHPVAIFSDDDPWVPLDNQDDFRDQLGAEIIVEHAKGHFSGRRDGTIEHPAALNALLRIAV